ncbi:Helix-turn-helix domain-containing protein [Nocardia amikacinitolerans]|uniref:Helix-turn-helix domain-containing protein n=1 Tax=Nocardia amikacinitolerans TaxID=756689 RepID=A0A285L8R0_9NOCA|nr:Helix-turn-helix domain-containing protein [Nocardia amikacinitolerans]SNY80437.1 Helix-turn-helix domain-containing protein [Nocardia amikacinitolerans]
MSHCAGVRKELEGRAESGSGRATLAAATACTVRRVSDNELGLFLRSRREAVTPARVGLPAGPRRRTPGLRRAELATLAGVSVEYITRLEQGRDRHPSPPVLAALADALQLAPSERIHLHRLTKTDPGFTCMGDAQPNRQVRATVRAMLDHLDPAAAVVINRLGEVLACTDGYRRLMGPTGLLDADPFANLARFVFADPRAREVYPDWDHVADQQVATLKQGPFRADPAIAALADELTVVAGDEFTDRVASVPSLPAATGITRLAHPTAGPLRLAYETLDLFADDDQQIIVHLPADDATAAALDALAGRRPGQLRAVSG